MISYDQSKKILKKAKIKIKDEKINSINSLNRVISSNVYSRINYPTGDNAAFDGYAINSKDTNQIKKNSQKQFKIMVFYHCSEEVGGETLMLLAVHSQIRNQ